MALHLPNISGISGSGLGITLVTSFIRWRLPKIPHYVASPGVAIGVGLLIMSVFPGVRIGTAIASLIAVALVAFAVEWQLAKPISRPAAEATPQKLPRLSGEGAGLSQGIPRSSRPSSSATLTAVRHFHAAAVTGAIANPIPLAPKTEQKVDIVGQLDAFVREGRAIQDAFMADDDAVKVRASQEAWSAKVIAFLRANVGIARATQFEMTDANPMDGQPSGHSEVGGYQWAKIVAKNKLLTQIMVEQPAR